MRTAPGASPDSRQHFRVPLVLAASIAVPADQLELDCQVINLSMGGAGLFYEAVAPSTSRVGTLDIPGFGKFYGLTVRSLGQNRGFRFLDGEADRNNLRGALSTYIANGLIPARTRRQHERHALNGTLVLQHPGGKAEDCEVVDISLEGVRLKTVCDAQCGKLLRVGRMYARVVRQLPDGLALKFVNLFGTEAPEVG